MLSSHTQRQKLHRIALARAGGSQDRNVRILINPGIKVIYNDQRIVMLIYPIQNPVAMTLGEGIRFDPENGNLEEKQRIVTFLHDRMEAMSKAPTPESLKKKKKHKKH